MRPLPGDPLPPAWPPPGPEAFAPAESSASYLDPGRDCLLTARSDGDRFVLALTGRQIELDPVAGHRLREQLDRWLGAR